MDVLKKIDNMLEGDKTEKLDESINLRPFANKLMDMAKMFMKSQVTDIKDIQDKKDIMDGIDNVTDSLEELSRLIAEYEKSKG